MCCKTGSDRLADIMVVARWMVAKQGERLGAEIVMEHMDRCIAIDTVAENTWLGHQYFYVSK